MKRLLASVSSAFVVLAGVASYGKGTAAGTVIQNVAKLQYNIGSDTFQAVSNTHTIVVDQLIELDVGCLHADVVPVRKGQKGVVLSFSLVNTGNGEDAFLLAPESNASLSGFENVRIYLDDGNGVFASSEDQPVQDVNLSADESVTLFLVTDIDANATWQNGYPGIEARSKTGGSGVPGYIYTLGSYRAVDGFKGGVDMGVCQVGVENFRVVITKSAEISSDKLYIGSTIRYSITARLEGYGTADDVVISDQLQEGLEYVSGSLKLNGSPLDENSYVSGRSIVIPVGDMSKTSTAETVNVIQFDAKVL